MNKLDLSGNLLVFSVIVMILAGLLLADCAWAKGDRDEGCKPESVRKEILFGKYECGMDSSGAVSHSIHWISSGDITAGADKGLHASGYLNENDCSDRVASIQSAASKLGCFIGDASHYLQADPPIENIGFDFICKGSRDKVIDVIFNLSSEVLAPASIVSH